MTKDSVQVAVNEIIAAQPSCETETLQQVHANGELLARQLRELGASDSEIEIWIADCARAVVRARGDEGAKQVDYLTAFVFGMGFVLSVDHATRKILIRPAAMQVH